MLRRLNDTDDVVVSAQVLIELRSVLTRKLKPAWSTQDTRRVLDAVAQFDVVPTNAEMALDAHELAALEQLSWFDALVAEAALRGGCGILYSEDFRHGQKLGGSLLVQNPFMAT